MINRRYVLVLATFAYIATLCSAANGDNHSEPVWACPQSSTGNADGASGMRHVELTPIAVSDNTCGGITDPVSNLCKVTYYPVCTQDFDCAKPGKCAAGICTTARDATDVDLTSLLYGDGDIPPGRTEIRCTATNACGLTSVCHVDLENSGFIPVAVDVELSPTMAPGSAADPIVRCIEFALTDCRLQCDNGADCDPQDPTACGNDPSQCSRPQTFASQEVTFGLPDSAPGLGTAEFQVPAGDWACVTGRDPKHSLRSTAFMQLEDGLLVAAFKGTPAQSPLSHWLIQGNLDGNSHIDIVDFTLLAAQYLSIAPNGNDAPCGDVGADADSDADGAVSLVDYSFIFNNFFLQDTDPCEFVCNPGGQ